MSSGLDKGQIERVVAAVGDELEGDWLLIGGALVALWLEPRRVTEDIDLIGISNRPSARMELMELAYRYGLPIEALNSAADFFVFRIADWAQEIELFQQGTRGRLFRPTPTLFVLLKLRRLSDHDLSDCLAAIARADRDGLRLDRERLGREFAALPSSTDAGLLARRAALAAALGPIQT